MMHGCSQFAFIGEIIKAYYFFFFFLIFVLSVLRVWDVLLFEGNRVMLFKTALALMELYGNEEILFIFFIF